MSKAHEMEQAAAREVLREVDARWRAVGHLTRWAALPMSQRERVIGELPQPERCRVGYGPVLLAVSHIK